MDDDVKQGVLWALGIFFVFAMIYGATHDPEPTGGSGSDGVPYTASVNG